MRYAMVFHAPEPADDGPRPTEQQIAEMQQLMSDYATALHEAGVLVAAEMLEPSASTTTVTRRTGSTVIEDGPFVEAREMLGGVWIIEVPDRGAAVAWAEKFPGASYGVVELRPVSVHVSEGTWRTA